MIECSAPGCPQKIKNNYWSKVKATNVWFFGKDDKAYCPNHIPAWVEEWRARRAKEKN